MYKVLVLENGNWTEVANSSSFSDCWDFAKYNLQGKTVKIVGPEGTFNVK